MDAVQYLSQGKFHRSIFCQRTQSRVTFALIGDWGQQEHLYHPRPSSTERTSSRDDGPLVLYILPSGCSRYIGILLDGLASSRGVRMVAIDRPGAGGTPLCPGVDRMQTSTKQTSSVLDFLGFSQVNILTHSAGWLYALHLVTERPDLFAKTSRMVFCSPFVPAHLSGNLPLRWLPGSVVQLFPLVSSSLRTCGDAFSWSAGVSEGIGKLGGVPTNSAEGAKRERDQKEQAGKSIRHKSQRRIPSAHFHPPYSTHISIGLKSSDEPDQSASRSRSTTSSAALHPRTGRPIKVGEDLLFEYFEMEGGAKAMAEEFLFCLGKVDGMDNQALERWICDKMQQFARICNAGEGARKNVVLLWAEKDFLVPAKGREYLSSLFRSSGLAAKSWVMADGGHDSPMAAKEVMVEAFDSLVLNGEMQNHEAEIPRMAQHIG